MHTVCENEITNMTLFFVTFFDAQPPTFCQLLQPGRLIQEVPAFRDFWFRMAIMKCGDHEFRGLFLV